VHKANGVKRLQDDHVENCISAKSEWL
jgi:hypothetical protein